MTSPPAPPTNWRIQILVLFGLFTLAAILNLAVAFAGRGPNPALNGVAGGFFTFAALATGVQWWLRTRRVSRS